MEKSITKVCDEAIVNDYLKKFKVAGGVMYECRNLTVFGTEYKLDQYCLLQGSKMNENVCMEGPLALFLSSNFQNLTKKKSRKVLSKSFGLIF